MNKGSEGAQSRVPRTGSIRRPAFCALAALSLSCCTRNTLIVVAPQAIHLADRTTCAKPAGFPATTPAPLPLSFDKHGHWFPLIAAEAGYTYGCAGVLYRIDPAGHVIDEDVVVVSPTGYGFAEAAVHFLSTLRYATDVIDPNWHYFEINFWRPGVPAITQLPSPVVEVAQDSLRPPRA